MPYFMPSMSWPRISLLLLGLIALGCGLKPAWADGDGRACLGSTRDVTLTIQPIDAKLVYIFSRSGEDFKAINPLPLPSNATLRGLTVHHLVGRLALTYQTQKIGTDWCLMPSSITVQAGFKDMTVYVDKHYPKDSCQRLAIIFHENKHVMINHDEMKAGLSQIETTMKAALANAALPIRVSDPKAGEHYLSDYFMSPLNRTLQDIADRMGRRNSALDTPREYANITARCPVW